ncbi:hypothetical protein BD626DRAFT_626304 [Schizophyllum amplum]|uniref:Btz domain-containing protein n=1 Tax=Schizophyllum amplum TaxID=97359 RepID=A0A550CT00_9AGAR|nr:hypothetical protein BD626DRAFT_626304 [Auriculariopsis ampla]
MPAPVASSSLLRTAESAAAPKARTQPAPKKTRTIRRRGPRRPVGDSDDEVEREAGSDSESDDTLSSATSDSDSELDEPQPHSHSHPLTPSTSQSPEDGASVTKDVLPSVNGQASFFTDTNAWSEMVADETAHGPAGLPEIDFQEFEGDMSTLNEATSRRSPSPEEAESSSSARLDDESENTPPSSRFKQRESVPGKTAGHSARQAYQKCLEDPAFVPVVGEFWGHDDRLLDKSLRSLSGWWRGRWQGQARGRGMGSRGRGRGGYLGGPGRPNEEQVEEENLPPVDRAWRHDGFEEMQKQDEQRRTVLQRRQLQQQLVPRGVNNFRGRGFAPPRGGYAPFRGSFNNSPSSRPTSLFPPRPFFAAKPEKVWTKQHDGYLHLDPAFKPRPGQGPAYRVRLANEPAAVVRATKYVPRWAAVSKPAVIISGPEAAVQEFVVRLPPKSVVKPSTVVMKPRHSVPPAEAPAVQPLSKATAPAALVAPSTTAPVSAPVDVHSVASTSTLPPPSVSAHVPEPEHVPEVPPPAVQPTAPPLVEQQPLLPTPPPALAHPGPIQTVFSPQPQSPSYGSPYGYAAPLPPGVAYNHLGMPYEVATGRPVYLQPPPPPPAPMPMYAPTTQPVMHAPAPQPVMHGMPSSGFMAGHMRHLSHVSSEYMSHTPVSAHTPPVNGLVDPATGVPLFAPPRQTSRVQIRAPTDAEDGKGKSSGLRSSATPFQPPIQQQQQSLPGTYAEYVEAENAQMNGHVAGTPSVDGQGYMGYNPYQQYYYPENYGYPYMDVAQANPYEAYPTDLQGGYYQ